MQSYIIEGNRKLEGIVQISGSKNASLPILAGAILNKGITKLYNVPNICDIQIAVEILKFLGCKVKKANGKIEIDARNMNKTEIPEELMSKMRSTVIMAGAIVGRFKEATFSYPGGYEILLIQFVSLKTLWSDYHTKTDIFFSITIKIVKIKYTRICTISACTDHVRTLEIQH